jgi:hypothetical protein
MLPKDEDGFGGDFDYDPTTNSANARLNPTAVQNESTALLMARDLLGVWSTVFRTNGLWKKVLHSCYK